MSKELIERFVADADVIGRLTRGLSPEELRSFPVAGTWSLQQLCAHLLDSDLIAVHRMKRIIAEDAPLLISYDETAFVAALHYQDLSITTIAELFRLNRLHMAEILEKLPDPAFDRHGIHSQRGRITLRENLEVYVHHVAHHLKFAREKRARLGKPLE